MLGRDDDLDGAIVDDPRARASAASSCASAAATCGAATCCSPAGTRLAPRHLAALAAAGVEIGERARRRLRVGVLTTGAELVADGEEPALRPGLRRERHRARGPASRRPAPSSPSRASSDDDPEAFARDPRRRGAAHPTSSSPPAASRRGRTRSSGRCCSRAAQTSTTVAMQPGGPQATAVVDGVPVFVLPRQPGEHAGLVRRLPARPAARRGRPARRSRRGRSL